ncbi:MAG: hypothetical protein IPN74_10370 [Haliscomenobacter sp.]|nr:hypothetical protein [Haliscomenobacter sp.]
MSGNDCKNTVVIAKVTTDLHCEAGTVTVSYACTKTTSKGTVTSTIGTVVITVQPVHEYNIMFPADLDGDCVNLRDTANVIDGGELSCDVLAVNVTDKRYNGATLNGAPIAECYKIFRTFTVINWCQYDERCGEPMQWAVVYLATRRTTHGYGGGSTSWFAIRTWIERKRSTTKTRMAPWPTRNDAVNWPTRETGNEG